MLRRRFVVIHRYIGLLIAGFLVITGLTGALLVWYDELDTFIISTYLMPGDPPSSPGPPLSVFTLREHVAQHFPGMMVNWLSLEPPGPGAALRFDLEPLPDYRGAVATTGFDEVFVNPYTGEIVGGRAWGDLSQGMINLMPFVFRLHHGLALGQTGAWLLGGVALLWLCDSLVGLVLTFPAAHRQRRTAARWLKRWGSGWVFRRDSGFRAVVGLHRALSLWLWGLLLLFALSSVAFNLYREVYRPVMGTFLTFAEEPARAFNALSRPRPVPGLDWADAYQIASQTMQDYGVTRGYRVIRFERFSYDPHKGVYKLMATTSRDVNQRFGQSWLYIDAATGAYRGLMLPTGEASGTTLTTWITTLHIAGMGGLSYRLLVSLLGLAVALLSVTGVLIWWRKSKPRRRFSIHRRA